MIVCCKHFIPPIVGESNERIHTYLLGEVRTYDARELSESFHISFRIVKYSCKIYIGFIENYENALLGMTYCLTES